MPFHFKIFMLKKNPNFALIPPKKTSQPVLPYRGTSGLHLAMAYHPRRLRPLAIMMHSLVSEIEKQFMYGTVYTLGQ